MKIAPSGSFAVHLLIQIALLAIPVVVVSAVLFALSGLVAVEACRAWPMASTLAAVALLVAVVALIGKRVTR